MGTYRDERIGAGRVQRWGIGATTLCLASMVGCGSSSPSPSDGGTTDVAVADGGDGGGTDGGMTDTGNGMMTDNGMGTDARTDVGPMGDIVPTDGGDGGPDAGMSPMPGAPTQFSAGPSFSRPLDAVPTASGASVYFIAFNAMGAPVVLRSMGGATTTVIAQGAPLDTPLGLAISADDSRIYIADAAAASSMTTAGEGAILSVGGEGGALTVVPLGAGIRTPRAVAVSGATGSEQLTFIATDDTGSGVFRVGTAGGTATRLDMGGLLMDPAALTVASDGTIFVLDSRGGGGTGALFRIPAAGGTPMPLIAQNLRTRSPGGIALSRDEHRILMSGWDPGNGPGLLTWVQTDGTMPTSPATYGLMAMGLVSPGGLHRARNADVYSVADELSADNGAVLALH